MLTWKPCLPKKVASKSPGFNIIEEYTLDEVKTMSVRDTNSGEEITRHVETNSVPESENAITDSPVGHDRIVTLKGMNSADADELVTHPVKLETSVAEHSNAQETGIPVEKLANMDIAKPQGINSAPAQLDTLESALHVATKTEGTGLASSDRREINENSPNTVDQCTSEENLHVGTPESDPVDQILLSQYPWKCNLVINLDPMQPLNIDIWSKKVREFHVYSAPKEVTPIISDIKGYGL